MTESPITSKRDTRKKDSAPRGVFCHRSGVWAVRFTCGAGHIHQEKVGPLKGDAIRIYYERRARAYDEPGWCPAVERARARERAAKDKTSQPLTFSEARDRYLTMKESEKKRSISDDRQNLGRLIAWFGPTTPLTEITAGRISDYRVSRANEMSRRRGGQPVSNATVNRELATLRHLLRLAHEEWEALDKVPVVKMLKEPQGRLRWLGQCAPEEEEGLIAAI